jgi:hypothetical protein
MTTAALPSRPRPFLPEDLHQPKGRSFCRAAFAFGRNALDGPGAQKGADRVAEQRWPSDRQAILLTKTATSPATLSSSGWAGVLSGTVTGDFLASLVSQSAAARLIDNGLMISLDGIYSVLIPRRAAGLPNTDTMWVQEAGPFPVRQIGLANAQLGPVKKLMSSIALTREMAQSSGGEEVFATLLREDIALSLDFSVFSNAAASASRPAGILAGVSAQTATSGGGEAALRSDLSKLGSVLTATGSGNVAIVASPGTALKLATYPTVIGPNVQVWPSAAVADGVVIAVVPDAFISGFNSVPKIATSQHALAHMEDTNPAQIGTGGVIASPARSMFQTDSILVRATLDCAWTLRASGAVAWIASGITW